MSESGRQRRVRQRLMRGGLIVGAALGVSAATWSAFRYGVVSTGTGLPVLGKVPEFSLVRSTGERLSQADLAGQAWIADFIFTRCESLCPTLSARMAKVQGALATEETNAVRLVSFSVDPTHDTPDVLREYGQRFGADARRWLFVTGDKATLHGLIGNGFHLAVAERPESENTDGDGLITHSDRFVLIDRDLQIRGYYHGTDEDSIKQLLRDVRALETETARR